VLVTAALPPVATARMPPLLLPAVETEPLVTETLPASAVAAMPTLDWPVVLTELLVTLTVDWPSALIPALMSPLVTTALLATMTVCPATLMPAEPIPLVWMVPLLVTFAWPWPAVTSMPVARSPVVVKLPLVTSALRGLAMTWMPIAFLPLVETVVLFTVTEPAWTKIPPAA
jgi:hypothetical protein